MQDGEILLHLVQHQPEVTQVRSDEICWGSK